MPKSHQTGDTQYAALPYRRTSAGTFLVMLLTSRETRRWVIPKGWPMSGKKPHRVAEVEALQEGGIIGTVSRKPFGSYHYTKEFPDRDQRLLVVDVYPMLVKKELRTWREAAERTRAWFTPDEAASLVAEGGLALLIGELEAAQKELFFLERKNQRTSII